MRCNIHYKQVPYLKKMTENTFSALNTVVCVCGAEAIYRNLRGPKRKGGKFEDIHEKSKPKEMMFVLTGTHSNLSSLARV